jgi:hypothetical protein
MLPVQSYTVQVCDATGDTICTIAGYKKNSGKTEILFKKQIIPLS